MVDDYKTRLEHAMKEAGSDAVKLRAHLKISYQGMAKVLAGGRFGMENNLKAAQFLGVRAEWLATGEGPMIDEEKRLFPEVAKLAAEINRLPKRQRDLVLLSIGNTVTLANTVTEADNQEGADPSSGLPPVHRAA